MKRRRIMLLAAAFLAAATLGALALAATNVPICIHIQGLLTDDLGEPVASSTLNMVFQIYNAETGGGMLWRETQLVTTDASGRWNAKLGAVSKLAHDVFEDTARWLEIVVEDKDTLSRVQLTTTPFSYRLSTVDGAAAGTLNGNLDVTGDLEVTGQLAPLGGIVTPSGITIQSTGSNVLVIAGTSQITVDPSGGVTIQSSAVTINSTGHLNVSADSTLTLEADRVEMLGTSYVGIAAPLLIATATDSIVLQSNRTARVSTGQQFTVDAGDDVLVQSDQLVAIDAGTDLSLSADRDVSLSAADSLVLVSAGDARLESGNNCEVKSNADMRILVSSTLDIDATGSVDLNSSTVLNLDGGVTTTMTGATVDIDGSLVTIN
jgi:hypothetical protein